MNLRFWQSAKPETRSAYDERLIELLHRQALAPAADLSGVGAALAAVSIVERCLAAVTVEPVLPVLTPTWFARVGRDLAWNGRHISLIDLDGDGLLLAPATSFDVASGGQLRQSNWRYTVDISLPDKTLRKTVSAASVVDISFGPGLQSRDTDGGHAVRVGSANPRRGQAFDTRQVVVAGRGGRTGRLTTTRWPPLPWTWAKLRGRRFLSRHHRNT